MCEDCYLKYNAHIEESKDRSLDNEAGEVVQRRRSKLIFWRFQDDDGQSRSLCCIT